MIDPFLSSSLLFVVHKQQFVFASKASVILVLIALLAPTTFAASERGATAQNDTSFFCTLLVICSAVILAIALLLLKRVRKEIQHSRTALKKSQTHLTLMGDKLPSITLFQLHKSPDAPYEFIYLSKGAEESLNINREELLQDATNALEYLYEQDRAILHTAAATSLSNLTPLNLEVRILDRNGSLRWLQLSAVPHQEENTTIWDGFAKDISETKNMENSLIEETQIFEQLFESIDDFLFICDMNGQLRHVNQSAALHLNYTADELSTMSLPELYPEMSRDKIVAIIARMQSSTKAASTLPLHNNTGQRISVGMTLFQGLWQEQPSIFCLARNSARHKETENALRESQQMLQLIMDNIPMSVFWTDKDSIYMGCNKSFIEEFQLQSPSHVIGKSPFDLFDPEAAQEQIHSDQHVINSNGPILNQLSPHTRNDNHIGWVESSRIPLHDEQSNPVGVLGVRRDVTEQYHAEERLKRTLEDMERFNQLMRGRERRTLQLKAEVNQLLKELGKPSKYRTTSDL